LIIPPSIPCSSFVLFFSLFLSILSSISFISSDPFLYSSYRYFIFPFIKFPSHSCFRFSFFFNINSLFFHGIQYPFHYVFILFMDEIVI
jgi:hypothetical protein